MDKPKLELKYFVLTPTKDNAFGEASRKAIKTFADAIQAYDENTYMDFAYELRQWMTTCEGNITQRAILKKTKSLEKPNLT